jgi:hypothetical protein
VDVRSAEMIMAGLRSNKSLTSFEYCNQLEDEELGASLMSGVSTLLRNTDSTITHLSMGLQNKNLYRLCDDVGWNTTLTSIHIRNHYLTDESVTAITGLLRRKNALKTINLEGVDFQDYKTMAYLLDALCRGELLTRFVLYDSAILSAPTDDAPPWLELIWAKMKVTNLHVANFALDLDDFSAMMVGIANNPHINELNLFYLRTEEKLQKLCEEILQSNRGPPTLRLNRIGSLGAILSDAMQQNTSVKNLAIGDLDPDGLVIFAQGLANMTGLRCLDFGYYGHTNHEYSKEFFEALQQSLEQNTTLKQLTICGMTDSYLVEAKPFLPRIKYLLAWNRVGRDSLLRAIAPSGLWAHILASSPVLHETSLIHFFLTSEPDITASFGCRPHYITAN